MITWFTGLIMYALIWWITLFAVLPLGVRPQAGADASTGWRGAPQRVRGARILLITTLAALVIWGGLAWLITSDIVSFRHGWLAMPDD
jgi:predicted secreted protein